MCTESFNAFSASSKTGHHGAAVDAFVAATDAHAGEYARARRAHSRLADLHDDEGNRALEAGQNRLAQKHFRASIAHREAEQQLGQSPSSAGEITDLEPVAPGLPEEDYPTANCFSDRALDDLGEDAPTMNNLEFLDDEPLPMSTPTMNVAHGDSNVSRALQDQVASDNGSSGASARLLALLGGQGASWSPSFDDQVGGHRRENQESPHPDEEYDDTGDNWAQRHLRRKLGLARNSLHPLAPMPYQGNSDVLPRTYIDQAGRIVSE